MKVQHARRIATALAAIGCAVFATAQGAGQACFYEVTAIVEAAPCPPSGWIPPLFGTGMNSLGDVTGFFHDCHQSGYDHGFFWTPQTGRVNMHKPEGVWRVNPTDINDAGLIVGTMQITGVGGQGFVYDMHTQQYVAILPPLHDGHPPLNIVSTINAINNAGIAAGARVISKPGVVPAVSNAVIWDANTGEVIDLGVGEGPNSIAVDGNNATDAAGWSGSSPISNNARALIWSDTVLIELGMLPGTIQSTASKINIHQDVIGSCRESNLAPSLPFFWTKGKMSPFPIPDGYNIAGASDLNDVGQIVGGMRVDPDPPSDPFLLQHGQFHPLIDLVIELPDNISLGVPRRIGNDGKILLPTSNNRAVLLTPADQPLGDLNHDCRVDVRDLQLLLGAWGPIPRVKRQTGLPADLNGDGVVDVSDLLILLANWSN